MAKKYLRIFLSVVFVLLPAPLKAEGEANTLRVPYVTPATVKAWREDREITFLDVRQADEFGVGHLPDAINIVYTEVASLVDRLPHDRPIVAYCIHSTYRAPTAVKILRELGLTNAYVLEGGIVAWEAGGLSIRANDPSQAPVILALKERCRSEEGLGK